MKHLNSSDSEDEDDDDEEEEDEVSEGDFEEEEEEVEDDEDEVESDEEESSSDAAENGNDSSDSEDEVVSFKSSSEESEFEQRVEKITNGDDDRAMNDDTPLWNYRRRRKKKPPNSDSSSGENNSQKENQAENGVSTSVKLMKKSKLRKSLGSSSSLDNNCGTRSWKKQTEIPTKRLSSNNNNDDVDTNANEDLEGEAETAGGGTLGAIKAYKSDRYHSADTQTILYQFYREKTAYPRRPDFVHLEAATGLTYKRILYWFSNRRRRDGLANSKKKKDENSPKEEVVVKDLREKLERMRRMKKEEEEQKKVLAEFYGGVSPYPTKDDFKKLGQKTGLSAKRLMYYFSNRRRKDGIVNSKKEIKEKISMNNKADINGEKDVDDDDDDEQEVLINGNDVEHVVDSSPSMDEEAKFAETKKETETEAIANVASSKAVVDRITISEDSEGVIGSCKNGFRCFLCGKFSTSCRPNLLRHMRVLHKIHPKACKRACLLVYRKEVYWDHPCLAASKYKGVKKKSKSDATSTSTETEAETTADEKKRRTPPKFYSSRYRKLLKKLNNEKGRLNNNQREECLSDAMARSRFHRNGKLELVMVTADQFNAVQEFILGEDSLKAGTRGRVIKTYCI